MSTSSAHLMRPNRLNHTIWGQYIQSIMLLGQTIALPAGITLNEKLNINPKFRLESTDRFSAKYYVIGNGSHTIPKAQDIVPTVNNVKHDPIDGAPFNMMPFALKSEHDDFPEEIRENYRLRRKEEHNGKSYWAYYMKKIEMEDVTRVLVETTQDGHHSVTPFHITERVLSPKRPELTPNEVVTASNTKIKISVGASINFDPSDVEEYMNVSKIIYGTADASVISEIALVAAVEDVYLAPEDGTRYTEVKGATVLTHISTYHQLNVNNAGFTEKLELGEKTPLPTTSEIVATIGVAPESVVVPKRNASGEVGG